MTAPTPDPGLRDKLAEVKARLAEVIGWEQPNTSRGGWADALADALLPVVAAHVEQQARERAAAELADAALQWQYLSEKSAPVVKFLRARAAALRGQA